MTKDSWAQVAKIRSEDRQWQAQIGYYAAEDAEGNPTQFTCHDTLFAHDKQDAIDTAKLHYPGIEIDTVFGHLVKPVSPKI